MVNYIQLTKAEAETLLETWKWQYSVYSNCKLENVPDDKLEMVLRDAHRKTYLQIKQKLELIIERGE